MQAKGFSNAVGWAACLICVCAGCAHIEVSEGRGEEHPDGFKTYPQRPYLLVEKGEKGTVSKLISLPDTQHPRYVRQRGVFGTAEASFTLDNGMVVSGGQKSDSKTPETIGALGTLLSSAGTGFGSVMTGLATTNGPAATGTKTLMNFRVEGGPPDKSSKLVIELTVSVIADAKQKLRELAAMLSDTDPFEKPLKSQLATSAANLNEHVSIPATSANIDMALSKHYKDNVAPEIKPLSDVLAKLQANIDKAKDSTGRVGVYQIVAKDMSAVIGSLSGLLPTSDIRLYRIDVDKNGIITFNQVAFPVQ